MTASADQYLLFVSVVTLIVVTPGPNLFLLLGITPDDGRSTGFLAVLGICAAILSHAGLALIGVAAIIATSAVLFTALKLAGAAYLVWLGVRSLLSLRVSEEPDVTTKIDGERVSASKAFIRGYVTNLLNPKPAIFYVALFPQFLSPDRPGTYMTGVVLGLTHAAVAALFYSTIVLLVSRARSFLARPSVSRAVRSLSGLALIALGGRLLLAKAPS